MTRASKLLGGTILASAAFMLPASAMAAKDDINPKELLNLSLEQLTNIEVTSVSKKSEKATEAAAAIFVITQDDIRRSGHTSIPELLRMVPGLSVARSNSHGWAITSRGTSNQFANKLLVLIDGRSVYTPLFSGVYWDIQDVVLQDIERIEVIRGPGATLWGANAVNGVINIITKSAKDTQGALASASVGTLDRSLNDVRYGVKIGDDAYVRMYAKYDDHDEFHTLTNAKSNDKWNKMQSGFRSDVTSGNMAYTLQGDIYHAGESSIRYLPDASGAPFISIRNNREIAEGANVLGRLTYKESQASTWTLQMYFDNTQRDNTISLGDHDSHNTYDLDLQQSWTGLERHEIVWGAGYRLITDEAKGTFYTFLNPSHRNDNLFSAFIQDKIALVPEEFFMTLGTKFERNDYTGFELQPSARLTWLISSNQTLWASAAHAVRTPNRFSDGTLLLDAATFGGAAYIAVIPNSAQESEKLNAYELGYRIQPLKTVSLDATTYFNDYARLITSSLGAPTAINIPGFGVTPIVPLSPVNGNSGTTSGFELAANWDPTSYWQLTGSYTRLNFVLKTAEAAGFTVKGLSPKNQYNIRSSLQLPHNLEMDNAVYYVDKLTGSTVPSYVRFDTRLAWKPMDGLELSLVGQNLFDKRHQEFPGFTLQDNGQVPRAFYGNITWKF